MCVERSHNFDDHLSRRSPGLGVSECITHLLEWKDLIHQRTDGALSTTPRLSQMFPSAFTKSTHNGVVLRAEARVGQQHDRETMMGLAPSFGKRWDGVLLCDAQHDTAGFTHSKHLRVFTTRAVRTT